MVKRQREADVKSSANASTTHVYIVPSWCPSAGPNLKLYTRGGDAGETGLVGGRRVSKDDPLVVACGELDELCSHLGLAQADVPPDLVPLAAILERVQHEIFILNAELATPKGAPPPAHRLEQRHVDRVEQEIDTFSEPFDAVHAFVLPRGTTMAARLHVARAVARRAERAVVRADRASPLRPVLLAYVNRLSGLLYAMALSVNLQSGFREVAPDYTR